MVERLETRNMYSSLQKYNKLYIVASCWTIIDISLHKIENTRVTIYLRSKERNLTTRKLTY